MTRRRIGVLVMSYGTPESMDQIEAYYTHIRHGHAPTPEQLAELTARYAAIVGGVFPLRENTNRQVSELERLLNENAGDTEFVCKQGLKHAFPFVADGVEALHREGVEEAVGIVLAPHYSRMSIGGYIREAREKADQLGLPIRFVESYHTHPLFIRALTERVEAKLNDFAKAGYAREEVRVLFTAHSLPASILETGDPYPDQLLETSRLVAGQTGVTGWSFVWQSAGRTAVPWLGPDILEVLPKLAEEGVRAVLTCPVGFVSDHLEVLYDLDIECVQAAERLGLMFARTESLNTDPLYLGTLKDKIEEVVQADVNKSR
ncbi:ferrochelatase [Gorillibacterium timonense]|uniref:ferrochelatase n=1 Tax=Gorillibacterium timonense TaxID=1689269 RepID=UPI00071DC530|nr:ferrochelatase [Gorillibacterium timonense]